MSYPNISPSNEADFPAIVEVWEASVRATHSFLKEEDILFYKSQIPLYLNAVKLFNIRDHTSQIIAFIGIADQTIEMLFIHPNQRGKGLGKQLINYVLPLGISKVDVNEQNEQALLFYLKMGFEIIGRSALDGSGKPYPILHMEIK